MTLRRLYPLAGVLLFATAPAGAADSDRAIDRVFFGVYGGVGQLSAGRIADPGGFDARAVLSGPSWAAGYDVGIWPTDYLGIDLSFEALDLSMGAVDPSRCAAGSLCQSQSFSGFGLRLSPALRLALPLRYVAPYVGAGPALLVPFFTSNGGSEPLHGTPGPQLGVRYFFGSSIYLSRGLRLFLDVHFVPVDLVSPMLTETGKAPIGDLQLAGSMARYLTLGLAFTPDDFKQSPSKASWIAMPVAVAVAASAVALGLSVQGTP